MIHPLARKHYAAIKRYPIALDEPDASICYLNLNINSEGQTHYKWYPPLKNRRLAESCIQMLCQLSGMRRETSLLTADHVLLSQGTTEAIDLIIRAFCEPKEDAIVVTSPTFSYYSYRAKIENVSVIDIPLQGEDLNRLNCTEILKHPAKVLFLCSPNNPVGTLLDLQEVERLIQQFPGIVVLDEAYIEWTERSSWMMKPLQYENLLVLRTFSKIWGLAGIRCGITIGSQSAIETLELVQTMFSFPAPSAEAIMHAIQDVECISLYRNQMKHKRVAFFNFLKKLKCVEKIFPGEANFLFVQFHDFHKIIEKLSKENILVCDTSSLYPRTLRISIGRQEEMDKLQRVLEQLESSLLCSCPDKRGY